MAALGFNRYATDLPKRERLPVASFFGGAYAALHIVCALRPHIAAQGSQYIEVSLFGAALNVLGRATVIVDDPRFADAGGQPRVPIYEIYRCSDGRDFQPHATFPHFAQIICDVGGHPEWGAAAGEGLRKVEDKAAELMWRRRFENMWSKKAALEWEKELERHQGSGTIARTYGEWMAEPHAHAAEIFVADGKGGWRTGPATRVKANRNAGPIDYKPVPERRYGRGGKALPLADVRVADFCIIIAGPTVGRILGDLGADVIKIEAPDRELSPYLWFDVNRGKRSIVLDLHKPEARTVARQLIEQADVVSENFRSGKFEALGFGYDACVVSRPDLIYASTNALDYEGPWERRAGWEHNAQAASGQQTARAENGVAQQVPFPVNDYATGMLGALGVAFAVLRRDLTGLGSRSRGSLVRSGTFLQLVCYEPYADAPKRLENALVLHCKDGYVSAWLPIGATEQQRAALSKISTAAATSMCDSLIGQLWAWGISAMREMKPKEMLKQPWVEACGLAVEWTHPVYGRIRQSTPRVTASGFETRADAPAPAPATDSRAILAEIGLAEKADALIASGAVLDKLLMFAEGG
jgi:crotonobetainyl-CoA:carnitine CoA-transferase CaiB-like acyl-CoA transferase